jgi:hypothetical protein
MTEPTVICPNCKTEIKLTESLAAPLIEAVRRDYEERLVQKEADVAKRESLLREQQEALSKARAGFDDEVAEKLKQERTKIAAEEARKAKQALANDLDEKTREIADLQEVLNQREVKLAEAQQAQADLIRKQRGRRVRISQRRDKKGLVSCKPDSHSDVGGRVLSGDTVHPQGVVRCEHVRG